MRTTRFWAFQRSMALVAAAMLSLAPGGVVTAQERPPGLLNKLDVRALVARGDPGDNDRLFVHFRVLWDRYLTEAERHDSMARSFVGNPNRAPGSATLAHCRQLATVNRDAAHTVRELALYHQRLAEGIPATLPPGAARFEGGAGAPEPTGQELAALAARAHTRTDHLALAEYWDTAAARHTRTAREHMWQALIHRGGRLAHVAGHHEHLARTAREAAHRATRTAEMQRQYALLGR